LHSEGKERERERERKGLLSKSRGAECLGGRREEREVEDYFESLRRGEEEEE